MSKQHKTSIGGQAVIEGIMMRGPEKTSLAVRLPNGSLDVETWENPKITAWYKKTPFVRGIFNFVDTMRLGYKCLMKSADKAGFDEGEPDKIDLWLNRHFGEKATAVLTGFASGYRSSCRCFDVFDPSYLCGERAGHAATVRWFCQLDRRAYQNCYFSRLYGGSKPYEGHPPDVFSITAPSIKTIFCYEAGEELTVENVRRQRRFHPRCGTSFLLIVVIVSVLVTSFVTWSNPWLRVVLKILLLPVVVGISYEIIKLAGRYTNLCTRMISAPGMWLQHITTQEPEDDMIEVAIASLKPVLPSVEGSDRW